MKIWRITFVVVVGFFVFGGTAAAAQAQQQVQVSVQRANVRDMPSLKGGVIFQVSRDETLRLIQKEGDWYWVENLSGRRGYISNTAVRLAGPVRVPSRSEPNVPTPLPPILQEPSSGNFKNSDVIAMAKAGFSDSIIIAAIRQSDSVEFDVSPAGLIALKTAGVSEAVIKTLLDRGGLADPSASSATIKDAPPVSDGPRTTGFLSESQQLVLTKPTRFNEWNNRLERARGKRGRGMKFAFIGIGTAIVGPLIGGAIISGGGGTGGTTFALITTLGGTGMIGYGGWTWYSARQEIEDLDQEGRIKGYLTLAPIPGGAQVALNLSF